MQPPAFPRLALASCLWRSLPNTLSVFRLGLAATFPLLPSAWHAAAVLVGGFTDWLDGWLCRTWNLATPLGRILDPLADKSFTLSVLLTLFARGRVPPLLLVLILTRDLVVLTGVVWVCVQGTRHQVREMPPRWGGKVATTLIFGWLVASVWSAADPPWLRGLGWLAGGASFVAGMDYMLAFLRNRRRLPSPATVEVEL